MEVGRGRQRPVPALGEKAAPPKPPPRETMEERALEFNRPGGALCERSRTPARSPASGSHPTLRIPVEANDRRPRRVHQLRTRGSRPGTHLRGRRQPEERARAGRRDPPLGPLGRCAWRARERAHGGSVQDGQGRRRVVPLRSGSRAASSGGRTVDAWIRDSRLQTSMLCDA